MYFIEKIKKKEQSVITPEFGDNYVLEDVITCHHHFLPIDSTGNIFACSKCGFVVKKDRLRKKKKEN